ncbi:MAG: carbohydrate kinase family protein [Ilumatobacteraceae bacterium]
MLCVVGDLVEDVVVRVGGPLVHGSDTPAVVERRRGGSGANVAVAAAALGCPTRFIGRVGDDALGGQLIDAIADGEVDPRVQVGGGRTGSVVVLVDADGERSMFPDRAESVGLAGVDPAWLHGVTWLHVPAYSLCAEPIGTTARELVRHARSTWARISVDVSSVSVVRSFGVDRFVALLRELAPDVVFANEDEADLVRSADVALLVVKHGPEPIELVHPGGRTEHVPVEVVEGRHDTTGAGDSFAGGYLASVVELGRSPTEAAGAGAGAAAALLRSRVADPE